MTIPMLAFVLGWPEMLAILFILLLFFGARFLPKLVRSIARLPGEFRAGRKADPEESARNDARKPPK